LLPYLYTQAHLASESGAPLIRPLWWPDGDCAKGSDSGIDGDDAFLLGHALLVAPVTEPGARERTVTLPPGGWASVWGDGRVGAAPVPAPLERIPVLARVGCVVPLDDGWAEPGGPCHVEGDAPGMAAGGGIGVALDHAPRLLAFHCWADEDGVATGVCVDDAGDGDGPTRRDQVRVEGARPGATARCTWERSGDFPAPPVVRVVLHGLSATRAVADGVEVPVTGAGVECAAFSELTLEGLAPAAPAGA
jgi:hypothetical protein